MADFLPPANSEIKGYLFMGLSSLCFGVMGVLVKLSSASLPFQEVTFFRAFGGLLLIGAWMAIARVPFHSEHRWLLLWRGVMGWAALTAYFFAISTLNLADAVLLNYTSPFFTALLAMLLLGERLTPSVCLCLLAASVGVAFVVGPKGGFWNWGALSALLSGLFAALAYVAVKRATLHNSPWIIVLYFSGVASLLTLPLVVGSYRGPSLVEWGLLAGVALSATVAQILMTYGYQYARASTASIVSLFTPLVSALFGIGFFQDVPTWGTWIGGALILGAGVGLAVKS